MGRVAEPAMFLCDVFFTKNNIQKMSLPAISEEAKTILDRFEHLQVTIFSMMVDFIVWNDLGRYPDIPKDEDRPATSARFERKHLNEFQIRYLYSPFEKSLVLGLSALLFDQSRGLTTLRDLSQKVLEGKHFEISEDSKLKLEETVDLLGDESAKTRFWKNRSEFIAHVSSIEASPENVVEAKQIYRLVPKTIFLEELLSEVIFPKLSMHYDNQFTSVARDIAPRLYHSRPDEYLAELFSKRSLPAGRFSQDFGDIIEKLFLRERAARQPARVANNPRR